MSITYVQYQGKMKEMAKDRGCSPGNKYVKKLRLMLQAGAPLGTVEQKATLKGIDMALFLSPLPDRGKEDEDAGTGKEDGEKALVVVLCCVVCRPLVFRDFPYAISIAGSRPSSPDPPDRPGLQLSGFPQGNGYPHKGTVDRKVAG